MAIYFARQFSDERAMQSGCDLNDIDPIHKRSRYAVRVSHRKRIVHSVIVLALRPYYA